MTGATSCFLCGNTMYEYVLDSWMWKLCVACDCAPITDGWSVLAGPPHLLISGNYWLPRRPETHG